ncbi:alpha beta hydrolase [Pyrenophora seminiperda CCB06]|uniref:Alpha beta hydrolase n=1 Tax=Pyrenophora seminiperda CCB06 TaxID=1302712 RepID=A0A3M7LZ64_9PLEO|nr:alpha beta hydrolase [Pyrenophora seminiperda CCB06]
MYLAQTLTMRILDSKNPWLTCPTHSALVPISTTHSLFASISGPLRTPASPLLIFFTGAGGPSACYTGIQRQLSPYIRSLFYDRAGYDRSTLPLDETRILCTATARDLRALLVETGLQGPYLLVAHSFGGIVARTFLHECAEGEVQGMLLFDTATELMLALFPRFPPLELEAVGRDVDLAAITHLQRDAGFSDAEWACAIRTVERSSYALSLEDTHASAHELALHRQIDNAAFGTRPLTVVQCNIASDYQLMYDEGIKLGGGTKEEREVSRWFIERTRLYHRQVARAQSWNGGGYGQGLVEENGSGRT